MQTKDYSKYIFLAIFVIFLFLTYKILSPYFVTLITAFVIALMFYPLYSWLRKKTRNKYIAAILVITVIVLMAVIPFVLLMNSLVDEINHTVTSIREQLTFAAPKDSIIINNTVYIPSPTNSFAEKKLVNGTYYEMYDLTDKDIGEILCEGNDNFFCEVHASTVEIFPDFRLGAYVVKAGGFLLNLAKNALSTVTSEILKFIMSLYIVFFLFLDGKKLLRYLKKHLSLKIMHEKHIEKTIKDTTIAVVFGSILTALIQGALAGLGYWLIGGLSGAILLGVLTAFFALIPGVGSGMIWFPTGMYVLISGLMQNDSSIWIRGLGLLAFGALFVSTIDNIIKPKIIGNRANIHPAIVFLGVLGGLSFTKSVVGIIIGPLVLAIFIKLVEILRLERDNL